MLKKPITYKDWNDLERTEDHYFNLEKHEIVKMQESVKGGYDVQLKAIAAGMNGAGIMQFFEDLIKASYGEKSEDGRRFMKSEEISRAFMETRAYSALFEEMITDAKAAAAFVNAIMPPDLVKQAADEIKKNDSAPAATN
jgi:hypothetical protein